MFKNSLTIRGKKLLKLAKLYKVKHVEG